MTVKRPLVAVITGAVAFTIAHVIQAAMWHSFDGAYSPWFLNSGRAVLFTSACFVGASAAIGLPGRASRAIRDGVLVALGGVLASVLILFWWVGPGTLFPVAIAIGALVLIASSVVGSGLRHLVDRRGARPR